MSKTLDKTAARIAAIFSRQEPSRAIVIDEIADDALKLADLGQKARRAIEQKKSPAAHVLAAKRIASRYHARVIDARDLNGAVMCLKFNSGLYSAGTHNLFYVA